jgi:hypothetical protein
VIVALNALLLLYAVVIDHHRSRQDEHGLRE